MKYFEYLNMIETSVQLYVKLYPADQDEAKRYQRWAGARLDDKFESLLAQIRTDASLNDEQKATLSKTIQEHSYKYLRLVGRTWRILDLIEETNKTHNTAKLGQLVDGCNIHGAFDRSKLKTVLHEL